MDTAHPPGANHHLVSRSYQQNFASADKRVSVISTATGDVVDRGRAIKSNFALPGFNDVESIDGGHDASLEAAFGSIERPVMDQIRRVRPGYAGPDQRAAVAQHFAMHLVRSEPYRAMHDDIVEQLRASEGPKYESNPDVFERAFGRAPSSDEVATIVSRCLDEMTAGNRSVAQSTARQYVRIADKLNSLRMQILWIDGDDLPGFILGDVPVVHALVGSDRYGFRDKLAIGDADLIVGPLTRRTAVCFTMARDPTTRIRTRKLVDTINAVFWRAAESKVACHPDDVVATKQLGNRLERLPLDRFRGS